MPGATNGTTQRHPDLDLMTVNRSPIQEKNPGGPPNKMNHAGTIQLIFGPMFSGKSTELLRRIRRYTVGQRSCLVIKYLADTRYDEEQVSTHDRSVFFE